MPASNDHQKRRYYITDENRAELEKRARLVNGSPRLDVPLNSCLGRYAAFCAAGLRRVWEALPDPQDQAFVRHVLMGIATDDLTLTENPVAYIAEIEEAARYAAEDAEVEGAELPYSPALLLALRRLGSVEAMGLVDWIEQEKIQRKGEPL